MSKLSLERIQVPLSNRDTSIAICDPKNPADEAFGRAFGLFLPGGTPNERLRKYVANLDPRSGNTAYYLMSRPLEATIGAAANAIHGFFIDATKRVIESDDMLRQLGIPDTLWERIRRSWATQRQTISARFDFLFDGTQVSCLEYNADSASTILECGRLQERTASALGITAGTTSSGDRIYPLLLEAWRNSGAVGRVHFCVEDDLEEIYTAGYVMDAAREVGLEPRLCPMFDSFRFAPDGSLVDTDGQPVRYIWKTWMWETAIQDELKARAERGPEWKPTPEAKVRLCDVMFSPFVHYYEPLWKVVTSNKALLPLIYEANPNHPSVLPASYTLTPTLQQRGYAKKPIVGRIGENVQLIDGQGAVMEASEGRFGERSVIYQQLVSSHLVGGHYALIGAWMLGGQYAGTVIREDSTPITGPFSSYGVIRVSNE